MHRVWIASLGLALAGGCSGGGPFLVTPNAEAQDLIDRGADIVVGCGLYASIEGAVHAIGAGGTVGVCSGSYEEQILPMAAYVIGSDAGKVHFDGLFTQHGGDFGPDCALSIEGVESNLGLGACSEIAVTDVLSDAVVVEVDGGARVSVVGGAYGSVSIDNLRDGQSEDDVSVVLANFGADEVRVGAVTGPLQVTITDLVVQSSLNVRDRDLRLDVDGLALGDTGIDVRCEDTLDVNMRGVSFGAGWLVVSDDGNARQCDVRLASSSFMGRSGSRPTIDLRGEHVDVLLEDIDVADGTNQAIRVHEARARFVDVRVTGHAVDDLHGSLIELHDAQVDVSGGRIGGNAARVSAITLYDSSVYVRDTVIESNRSLIDHAAVNIGGFGEGSFFEFVDVRFGAGSSANAPHDLALGRETWDVRQLATGKCDTETGRCTW